VAGDDDFEASKSTGFLCLKSIRNSKKQTKKLKELLNMIENSNILLNKTDSKILYYAIKRVFYCCIRATDDDNKKKAPAKRGQAHSLKEPDYELSSIDFSSETKIDTESIAELHKDPLQSIVEDRDPMDPSFRYDEIIEQEGHSQALQDELVKVSPVWLMQLLTSLNLIESSALSISDVFFNVEDKFQYPAFQVCF
jgi:hypothetical protein